MNGQEWARTKRSFNDPVLDAYRLYEHERHPDKPLFPKYGNTRGFENVAAKLGHVVNELMGIKNPDLVP